MSSHHRVHIIFIALLIAVGLLGTLRPFRSAIFSYGSVS
jgi:hypothetical protein